MKQRIITALIVLAIAVPLLIINSWTTFGLVIAVMMLGTYELLNIKKDLHIPLYFKIAVYLFVLLTILTPYLSNLIVNGSFALSSNVKIHVEIGFIVLYLFILLAIKLPIKEMDITYVFYIFTMSLVLGVAGQALAVIRSNLGIYATIYLLFVTYINDAFAYFIGIKFGKHKMAPLISPKKSWEGFVGGIIGATLLGSIYFIIFPFGNKDVVLAIVLSLVLALGGVFGDLLFSSIKRHYEVKDFSNLLPGHGGILDRIDSVVLNLILFVIVYSIVLGGFYI